MRGLGQCVRAVAIALMLCLYVGSLFAEAPTYLIEKHADWRYYAAKTPPPKAWTQLEFDASAWKTGTAGFGYDDDDDHTVLQDMRHNYSVVFIRHEFEVESIDDFESLFLYLNYDDGFVAYLNGRQVAADSVRLIDGELTVDLHEASGYEEFVIKGAADLLKVGNNVLAIEGHNANIDSSDFSLSPCLLSEKLPSIDALISDQDLRNDLDEFEERLLSQSSYLTRRGYDYEPDLEELRQSITDETTLNQFASRLQKIVMQIGDCHANVHSTRAWPLKGFLPFRPAQTGQGIAALKINSNETLDAECPYVESIDSIPLKEWLAVAGKYAPAGSPQLIRRRSLEWLSIFTILRQELGVPESKTVTIGLRSADGTKRSEQKLRLTEQGYSIAELRLGGARFLDGNIGYLRLRSMDSRLIGPIVKLIGQFKNTNGLIIDVRDNYGGNYSVLQEIYGFFVAPDAEPYVSNIAAYRLSPRFDKDHLAYRPTFRANWNGWSDAERKSIKKAADQFNPEWRPPESEFSEWHYMVLSRQRGRQEYFHYDKPVVVLCNSGSFSATDGFLGAFSDLPQATLVGQPSGGGSGANRRFRLKNSEVYVSLSSMASFRANGKTFDGNGIEVDVLVQPTIEDYLTEQDSVLDRGMSVIQERLDAK